VLIALRALPGEVEKVKQMISVVIAMLKDQETRMARFDDALANLDAQLDDLVDYVNSDDETDAVAVEERAERIKAALADLRAEDAEAPAEGEETVVDTAPGSQSDA